ncbi:MAG: YggS family pyridoxal phosphate-dependent enzyme [Alphaproteobacteria bacterium HGW-Alphaproteobacteria-4]|nr:MAG: YggS family pyridoxal phosphate-dependent enzyme [Alphaproteobacteria bacterium HGW-Alphaproteobacteria-4]
MGLAEITSRLRAAEARAGRAAGAVTLIAVSKLQPGARVAEVLRQGQRVFGENYVQEAAAKWPAWRAEFQGVKLHLIGPLQSNKAKAAVELFDAIHTLDRPSLADRLARLAEARGQCPEVFVQVNTGAEPQKAGVLPDALDRFVADCRALGLPLAGLMCIPPEAEDAAPHFAMLAAMAARNGLAGLSMGMSSDFEAAVAAGATHVRIGSAIFGPRT